MEEEIKALKEEKARRIRQLERVNLPKLKLKWMNFILNSKKLKMIFR